MPPNAMKESLDDIFKKKPHKVTHTVVEVAPNKGRAVSLGIYEDSEPDPDFELTVTPDVDESLGISIEHLPITGEHRYMLLYQFHNFGSKLCTVTLELQRPSKQEGE